MSEKIKYSYEKNETACIYSEILQRVNIFILCFIIDTIRTKPPVLDRILKKILFCKKFCINKFERRKMSI